MQVDRATFVANSVPRVIALFTTTRMEGRAETEYMQPVKIDGHSSKVLVLPDVFDCAEHQYSVYVRLAACSPWSGAAGP